MRRFLNLILPLVMAVVGSWALAAPARAASSGVVDEGHFFSTDAIAKAEALIRDIKTTDNRDVLVVTYDSVPAERQDEMSSKGRNRFFADWADEIAVQHRVTGVFILMIKNPGHLEVSVGEKTLQHSFTSDDREQLKNKMLGFLRLKQYDEALLQGLQIIKERMKPVPASGSAAQNSTATPTYPGYPNSSNPTRATGFPVGGLVCVGVAILIVVMIVMGIASRSRGYGGGYGAPPPGGYPPGYSGGYPQGGGYGYGGGGGGGGFGRGLLGGLLGGALGAWGYEKFNRPDNSSNFPPTGGSSSGGDFGNASQADTTFSGTGGDFDSGGSSSSSGGDFGSSSDSSSAGGGDFGGGGGGGGGDFGGGGGDSGGSSGGDF